VLKALLSFNPKIERSVKTAAQLFYGSDGLPVTQPTVLKHRRDSKNWQQPGTLSRFLHHQDKTHRGTLHVSCPMS